MCATPDLKEIINTKTTEELMDLSGFMMECGTEDFLVYESIVSFDELIEGKGVTYSFIERSGSQDWTFLKFCLYKALVGVIGQLDQYLNNV